MKKLVCLLIAIMCILTVDGKSVKVGKVVPDFSLSDESLRMHSLSQYRGKKVVLAFYPVGSIPYCRLEAETLRAEFIKLQEAGIVIFGINTESQKEHLEFKNRLKIPFSLLTADKKMLSLFDVDGWFGEVKRKTFLINEQGVLIKIIDDVKLKKHHVQILDGFK